MNIQTAKSKNHRKQIKEHSDWSFYCGMILKLILLLLAVFAVANAYIYLNQQIQNIERDNVAVSRKIENIEREIKYLQNRYEYASSRSMIDRQIARFNLKLREPSHSQIKIISLNETDRTSLQSAEKDFAVPDYRYGTDIRMADIDRPVR